MLYFNGMLCYWSTSLWLAMSFCLSFRKGLGICPQCRRPWPVTAWEWGQAARSLPIRWFTFSQEEKGQRKRARGKYLGSWGQPPTCYREHGGSTTRVKMGDPWSVKENVLMIFISTSDYDIIPVQVSTWPFQNFLHTPLYFLTQRLPHLVWLNLTN